jgi:hypothetical protein
MCGRASCVACSDRSRGMARGGGVVTTRCATSSFVCRRLPYTRCRVERVRAPIIRTYTCLFVDVLRGRARVLAQCTLRRAGVVRCECVNLRCDANTRIRTNVAQPLAAVRSRRTPPRSDVRLMRAPCGGLRSHAPQQSLSRATMRSAGCLVFFVTSLLACVATCALASVQIDFFDAVDTATGVALCSQAPIQTLALKGDNSCEAFSVGSSVLYYAKSFCQTSQNCVSVRMAFYTSADCTGASSSTETWYSSACSHPSATCVLK